MSKSTAKKAKNHVQDKGEATGLGSYLRGLRVHNGLSQKKVAIALGYDNYQFIYNMEKEKCLPPRAHIRSIAKLYKVEDKKIRAEIVKHLYAKIRRKYGFK